MTREAAKAEYVTLRREWTKLTGWDKYEFDAGCRCNLGMCPDGCCGREDNRPTPAEWVQAARKVLTSARARKAA